MQTIYKLIFAMLVLKARRDELRRHAAHSAGELKRHLSCDTALPPHDAALARTR